MAIALYEPAQEASSFLAEVRAVLQDFAERFRGQALLLSTRELADTVAAVEELSKTVEQLQITGAHALDRCDIAAVGETDSRFGRPAADGDGAGRGTDCRNTAEYL